MAVGLPRRGLWIALGAAVALLLAEGAARLVLAGSPEAIRWYDEAAQLKIEQMDERGEVDVVFAGTSMAWQAFVPETFEAETTTPLASYNAGLNGGTPEVMERWLLEEVVPRLHPDTVVWGLSSLDLAPNYGAQQRAVYDDALATRTGWLATVEQRAAGWSALVANRTVLRSFDDTVGPGADEREAALARADEHLGAGGERLDFSIDRSERQAQITRARLREFAPDPDDTERIRRVVTALRADGIDVVLIELPVPDRFVDAHPAGATDHARVRGALDAIASDTGVRFLDLSTGFDDDDFVDFAHLDQAAAARFTSQVAAVLASGRDDRGTSAPVGETPPGGTGSGDPTDCDVETIIDDYGFEIEVNSCGPPASPEAIDPAAVLAALPEDHPLVAAADERDRSCRAGESPAPGLRALAAAIDGTTLDLAGEDGPSLSLAYVLAQYVALASGDCDEPSADPEVSAATAAITSALDRLYAIRDVPDRRASGIWSGRDHLVASIWIRAALDRGLTVDGLVIGNSASRTGFDPVLLGELTGTTVGQASVAGMSPETTGPLLDEVIDLVDPTTVYWAISYFDLYSVCFTETRADRAAAAGAARADAFAGIVSDSARRTWDHFLGPDGTTAYGESPILSTVDEQAVIDTLGRDDLSRTAFDPTALAAQLDGIGTLWLPDEPCVDRREYIVEHTRRLQSEGRTVVIVALPPNPDFAGGAAGVAAYFADAAALVEPAAPDRYLALDLDIDRARYRDGIHYLEDGRTELTEAFAAALARPDES